MPRLADLRRHVDTKYLSNNIISGAEAKDLVGRAKDSGALTAGGKAQLETLRAEFVDRFSDAGLREFDKAFARATDDAGLPSAPSGPGNAVSVFGGRDLSALPTAFRLSEIQDTGVRRLLKRMDLNIDGKVDSRDRDKLGLNDEQFRMFVFSALLMGKDVDANLDVPTDLTGKTVVFSAVPDKAEATRMAKEMGATIARDVSEDIDFLIVGDAAITGKDERALALNTLGVAEIGVGPWMKFLAAADAAGVQGPPAPGTLTSAAFDAMATKHIEDWYTDDVKESYDHQISNASTPAERDQLMADRQEDLDTGVDIVSDSYWEDMVDDQYEYDSPYKDAFGQDVPRDNVVVMAASFYPVYAGIGLSKTFVFDDRNGNLLDEGDIMD